MAKGSSYTTQDELLRTVYQRRWRRQFPTRSILLQTLRRQTESLAEGDHVSIGTHAELGGSVSWSKTNQLPPADAEQVARMSFWQRMLGVTIEIDGTFISRAKSKQAADMQPLTLEMDSKLKLARLTTNWHLYRDGSGLLATPAGATAVDTLTVDSVAGLRTNMRVDILLVSSGAPDAGGVVGAKVNVNRLTKTVTLRSPQQMADYNAIQANPTDYGVYLHKSYCAAPFGLAAVIDTGNPPANVGNYGGIDRTNDLNDWFRGKVHHNSGSTRVPSDLLMQNLIDDIEGNSDGEVKLILVPPNLWSSIANVLVGRKQYDGQMMTLNGWATAIKWADKFLVRDHHCQPDRMYFLDPSTFIISQNNAGAWMDEDGAILSRVKGAVAYEAAWYQKLQLMCVAPGANGVLKDLKQA